MHLINTAAAMDELRKILAAAAEAGIIDDYAECPGVPRYDVETTDGAWLQIKVIGDIVPRPDVPRETPRADSADDEEEEPRWEHRQDWRHCSPNLLATGVSCAKTPRRPCECFAGGSHDHLVDLASWGARQAEQDNAGTNVSRETGAP